MVCEREVRQREEQDAIQNEYFEWIVRLVCGGRYARRLSWRKLFRLLHETDFVYMDMDRNRAKDGIDLRYTFGYEAGYGDRAIQETLDTRPCSVLEMLAALANRCEEDITDDPEKGDRTGKWFFVMLDSLGLSGMDDEHFNKVECADILERFMRRAYQPDGRGGLFTVSDSGCDMRGVEIWYQLMRYLNEAVYGSGRSERLIKP